MDIKKLISEIEADTKIDELKVSNSNLTIGEISILLSYTKLFEHLINIGSEDAIVIEDDVYPCPIFDLIHDKMNISDLIFRYIELCRTEFPELQLLMMIRPTMHSKRVKISKEYNYCYKIAEAPWGAFCNYYTKEGIKNIYESALKISHPFDHYDKISALKSKIALTKMPFGFHFEHGNLFTTYK